MEQLNSGWANGNYAYFHFCPHSYSWKIQGQLPTRFRRLNFGISASRKSFAAFMSHSFKLCNFRSAQFLQGFYVLRIKRWIWIVIGTGTKKMLGKRNACFLAIEPESFHLLYLGDRKLRISTAGKQTYYTLWFTSFLQFLCVYLLLVFRQKQSDLKIIWKFRICSFRIGCSIRWARYMDKLCKWLKLSFKVHWLFMYFFAFVKGIMIYYSAQGLLDF